MIYVEEHISEYGCAMFVEHEVEQLVTEHTNSILSIVDRVVESCKHIINNERKE